MWLYYWKWSCPESCHLAPCLVLQLQRHFFLTLQPRNIMHHEIYLCPLAFLAHVLAATAVYDCMPLHFHRAFWKRYSAMARILRDTHPVPINCLMSSEQFRPTGCVHSILRPETTYPRCSSCGELTHSSSCLQYSWKYKVFGVLTTIFIISVWFYWCGCMYMYGLCVI